MKMKQKRVEVSTWISLASVLILISLGAFLFGEGITGLSVGSFSLGLPVEIENSTSNEINEVIEAPAIQEPLNDYEETIPIIEPVLDTEETIPVIEEEIPSIEEKTSEETTTDIEVPEKEAETAPIQTPELITPSENISESNESTSTTEDNLTQIGLEGTLEVQTEEATSTSCGYVSSDLTLESDVINESTCFTINASDITLDCAGYTINYSTAGTLGYGINNTAGHNRTTIKNCNINESVTTTNYKYAIYFLGAENGTIDNNNITTIGSYSYGIYLQSSSNLNNLTNNIINTSGGSTHGIYLSSSSNSTLTNNTVDTTGTYSYGIYLLSSLNSSLTNNTIITGEAYGLYLSSSSNSTLTSNTVTVREGVGIDLTASSNSTLNSNIVTTNNGHGAYLESSSHSNTLTNNTINATGGHGIYLDSSSLMNLTDNDINTSEGDGIYLGSSSNSYLVNNIILADGSSDGDGITLSVSSSNNLTHNIITSNQRDGIVITTSNSNKLTNNTITTDDDDGDGIVLSTASNNNVLLNNNISSTSYEIIDTTGNSYINYLIYNNTYGEIRWTDTTNGGFLKDMDVNGSIALGTNLFIGNNTVALNTSAFATTLNINSSANVTLNGLSFSTIDEIIRLETYSTDRSEILAGGSNCNGSSCEILNYDGDTGVLLFNTTHFSSFSAAETCGYINSNTTLNKNHSSSGTCFTINASDITLDCAGYTINYSTAGTLGYGINNTAGHNRTTIKNCNVLESVTTTNSKHGIYFLGAENGTIEDNNITTIGSAAYGIYLQSLSDSNNVTNNIINTSGSQAHGIYLSSSSNSTLTNNDMDTTGTNSYGIYLLSSLNSTLTNNTITTDEAYGLYLSSSSNSTLTSNTVIVGEGVGIDLTTSSNSTLTDNIVTTTNGHGAYLESSSHSNTLTNNTINATDGHGIYLDSSSLMNLTDNNITTSEGDGIYLGSSSNSVLVSNNILANGSTDGDGITLSDSSSNNLTDNIITSNYGDGISLASTSNSNILTNNTVSTTATDGDGINLGSSSISNSISSNNVVASGTNGNGFYLSSNSNTFTNNTLTTSGTSGHGIYVVDSNLNNFTNNTIAASGSDGAGACLRSAEENIFESNYVHSSTIGYAFLNLDQQGNNFTLEKVINNSNGIYIGITSASGLSYDNTFRDCNFSDNDLDLNVTRVSIRTNITLVNSSIDKDKLSIPGTAEAYFKWYVDVNVTDSTQNVLEGVTVKAYDSLNALENTSLTDSEGIARLEVTEFYRTSDVNYYVTPALVKASKGNYTHNETSVNLYNTTYALTNLTLTRVDCGGTVSTDFELGNNYDCGELGLIIGADNITCDGKGYNITGNGSGIGINLSSKTGIEIVDLRITNFTEGIYLYNANNSNVNTSTIINNTRGVVFNESNNNIIYGSIIANNSEYNVIATNAEGTNNSLVNVSIDLDNISVSGTANIFLKWYVDVNISYTDENNNEGQLQSANVSGYFNSSGELDHSLSSNSDGMAQLILTELNKNATGTYYLTPHNVTISFTSISGSGVNSTYINLTQTNSTQTNLSLDLDCTSPYSNMNISSNTIFCPGTFQADMVTIGDDNVNLTCDGTILKPETMANKNGIYFKLKNNITVSNCDLRDYSSSAIYLENVTNVTISWNNISDSGVGIRCVNTQEHTSSRNFFSSNKLTSNHYGMVLYWCDNSSVTGNTFESTTTGLHGNYGAYIDVRNTTFQNNTFDGLTGGIYFTKNALVSNLQTTSTNNSFYYNVFSNITLYNIYYFNASHFTHTNQFNTTVNNYAQGNKYGDYCDMGTDSNNDGYADDDTSNEVDDWPYSEDISDKVYDPTNNNAGVIDWGPKMFPCSAAEVFLGSDTGGAVTKAVTTTEAVEVPPKKGEVTKPEIKEATLEEIIKSLKTETSKIEGLEKITKVKVTLENTGTKIISLFPELSQEIGDSFFIVDKKTLGFEGSFFSRLAGIAYSKNKIAGRLLKAEILNPEQIVLGPGEKIDKTMEIREGLVAPRQLKIQFTTLGNVVKEEEIEIERKTVSGTAVDVESNQNLIDVYAIIVPVTSESEAYSNNQPLTGAATANLNSQDDYLLELNLIRNGKKTSFSDLYGPYELKKEQQTFVFAQQLKYNPQIFAGDYMLQTKIYQGNKVIVENEFDVNLGGFIFDWSLISSLTETIIGLSWLWLLIIFLLFGGLTAHRSLKEEKEKLVKKIPEPPKRRVIDKPVRKINLMPLFNLFKRNLSIAITKLSLFLKNIYQLLLRAIKKQRIARADNKGKEKAQQLLNFILDSKAKGIPKEQIKKILFEKGWSKEIVEEYIKEIEKKIKKVRRKRKRKKGNKKKALALSKFIDDCLAGGIPKDRIKKILIENGWPQKIVEEYVKCTKK